MSKKTFDCPNGHLVLGAMAALQMCPKCPDLPIDWMGSQYVAGVAARVKLVQRPNVFQSLMLSVQKAKGKQEKQEQLEAIKEFLVMLHRPEIYKQIEDSRQVMELGLDDNDTEGIDKVDDSQIAWSIPRDEAEWNAIADELAELEQ